MRYDETTTTNETVSTTALHLEDEKNVRSMNSHITAQPGDVVTVEFSLTPENGYVPDTLFDTDGTVSLVLGWGNYLPGLHALIEGMSVGEETSDSIDAGWGERNPSLVVKVAKKKIRSVKDVNILKVGSKIYLEGGIQVFVTEVTDDAIVVDGNPPLAGSSFACSVKLLSIDPSVSNQSMVYSREGTQASSREEQSPYQAATFAVGCFWGGELAFLRTPGVVGTKVGYTQGRTAHPSYEEVCEGVTQHTESILVIYDTRVVSYSALLEVAMERLAATSAPQYQLMTRNFFEMDVDSMQYRHGVFYHNDEQRKLAEERIRDDNNKFRVEIKPAVTFYDAEEYHQQYLLKGGQSAKKGSKEGIRCFG